MLLGHRNISQKQVESVVQIAKLDSLIARESPGLETPIQEGAPNLSILDRKKLCLARVLLNRQAF